MQSIPNRPASPIHLPSEGSNSPIALHSSETSASSTLLPVIPSITPYTDRELSIMIDVETKSIKPVLAAYLKASEYNATFASRLILTVDSLVARISSVAEPLFSKLEEYFIAMALAYGLFQAQGKSFFDFHLRKLRVIKGEEGIAIQRAVWILLEKITQGANNPQLKHLLKSSHPVGFLLKKENLERLYECRQMQIVLAMENLTTWCRNYPNLYSPRVVSAAQQQSWLDFLSRGVTLLSPHLDQLPYKKIFQSILELPILLDQFSELSPLKIDFLTQVGGLISEKCDLGKEIFQTPSGFRLIHSIYQMYVTDQKKLEKRESLDHLLQYCSLFKNQKALNNLGLDIQSIYVEYANYLESLDFRKIKRPEFYQIIIYMLKDTVIEIRDRLDAEPTKNDFPEDRKEELGRGVRYYFLREMMPKLIGSLDKQLKVFDTINFSILQNAKIPKYLISSFDSNFLITSKIKRKLCQLINFEVMLNEEDKFFYKEWIKAVRKNNRLITAPGIAILPKTIEDAMKNLVEKEGDEWNQAKEERPIGLLFRVINQFLYTNPKVKIPFDFALLSPAIKTLKNRIDKIENGDDLKNKKELLVDIKDFLENASKIKSRSDSIIFLEWLQGWEPLSDHIRVWIFCNKEYAFLNFWFQGKGIMESNRLAARVAKDIENSESRFKNLEEYINMGVASEIIYRFLSLPKKEKCHITLQEYPLLDRVFEIFKIYSGVKYVCGPNTSIEVESSDGIKEDCLVCYRKSESKEDLSIASKDVMNQTVSKEEPLKEIMKRVEEIFNPSEEVGDREEKEHLLRRKVASFPPKKTLSEVFDEMSKERNSRYALRRSKNAQEVLTQELEEYHIERRYESLGTNQKNFIDQIFSRKLVGNSGFSIAEITTGLDLLSEYLVWSREKNVLKVKANLEYLRSSLTITSDHASMDETILQKVAQNIITSSHIHEGILDPAFIKKLREIFSIIGLAPAENY